jgi:hypothetical protein
MCSINKVDNPLWILIFRNNTLLWLFFEKSGVCEKPNGELKRNIRVIKTEDSESLV